MTKKRIRSSQLRMGPGEPLARRGCTIEDSLDVHSFKLFRDTPFHALRGRELAAARQMLRAEGSKVFHVLKQLRRADTASTDLLQEEHHEILIKLQGWGVLRGDCGPTRVGTSYQWGRGAGRGLGGLFEALTAMAVDEIGLQAERDVKIRYPYRQNLYDPDGQKYDVLVGLDLSRLLWIECKKPLYLTPRNGLSTVVSRDTVEKFLKRADFLAPDIAVLLVDTFDREDYTQRVVPVLENMFEPERVTTNFFEECNIIATVDHRVYFALVNRRRPDLLFPEVQEAIRQVLHDARKRLLGRNPG